MRRSRSSSRSAANMASQFRAVLRFPLQPLHMLRFRRQDVRQFIGSAQACILVLAQPVVGKQVDLLHPGEGVRKPGDGPDFLRGGIEGGDHGHPDAKAGLAGGGDFLHVLQHQLIAFSGKLFVFGAVHMFDIAEIVVEPGQNFPDHLPLGAGHTLHGGVDAHRLRRVKQVAGKFRLAEALPAGEGQSPAGAVVIGPVLLHGLHDLRHSHVPADGLGLALDGHLLDAVLLGFRVAAPFAPQHTALEKADSADSRSVVNGIALYVEDSSLCL